MTRKVTKHAFGRYIVSLPISRITAQREVSTTTRNSSCYKQIASSLEHVGLIEPLVVYEQPDGDFILVDGNTRFSILKARGVAEVACIVAKDDEAYTYNRRVSHVPMITQHFMLLRVLENGVSEERVAAALNVDISAIRRKRDLVKGICPEVVSLLESHRLGERAFAILRKMKPLRQIESSELMIASNNFSFRFLNAMLSTTRVELLVSRGPKGKGRIHDSAMASNLETEHTVLMRDLKAIEKSYGIDMLTLAVSIGYVERLLKNTRVKNYLEQSCPETLALLLELLQERQGQHDAASALKSRRFLPIATSGPGAPSRVPFG
jgi:RepB plasmid partitioning protein/ParB-like nuclease domain